MDAGEALLEDRYPAPVSLGREALPEHRRPDARVGREHRSRCAPSGSSWLGPAPGCPALPCPALPCPALPCPALPCPALRRVPATVRAVRPRPVRRVRSRGGATRAGDPGRFRCGRHLGGATSSPACRKAEEGPARCAGPSSIVVSRVGRTRQARGVTTGEVPIVTRLVRLCVASGDHLVVRDLVDHVELRNVGLVRGRRDHGHEDEGDNRRDQRVETGLDRGMPRKNTGASRSRRRPTPGRR